jgi:hypothetical protein
MRPGELASPGGARGFRRPGHPSDRQYGELFNHGPAVDSGRASVPL